VAPHTDVWLENLRDERDGAALYDGLAALEKDPARQASFRELAEGERRHAAIWSQKLQAAGVALPAPSASARTRLLLRMARLLGTGAVLPMVIQAEAFDADKYARQGGRTASALAEDERLHRERLAQMGPAPAPRAAIAGRESWHRAGRGGAVRAAVFGMNDGVVSNLSLVLGVAGAGVGARGLLLTGLAGLLAGASSMAVGEYTSVASQRDLLARQIDLERRELAEAPDEERAELALILERKGLEPEQAASAAADILKNPEHGLDTMVREELGLDPDDLGAPAQAAASSFVTFAVGALVPLAPFLFASGAVAIAASVGAAALVLGAVGGFIGVLSGTSPWRSGARMIALAATAAGVTYALGRLFGQVVG
jgi:VIT1/CCC1 family predicted Fe2+/Mn2+ transporter